jgi:hypothetical protein
VTADQSPLSANAAGAAVSKAITGLTCGTTYNFRVAGTNSVGGPVNGNNMTFPTLACNIVCTYALSPPDMSNVPKAGGTFNVTVTTAAGCPVTAASFQPWVSVNSITLNGGTTNVSLQIGANAGAARATSIVVGGQLYLITQQAGP